MIYAFPCEIYYLPLRDAGTETAPSGATFHFVGVRDLSAEFKSFVEHLKRTHVSTPIILVSHTLREDVALWALRAGVWNYMILPKETYYLNVTLRCFIDHVAKRSVVGRRSVHAEANRVVSRSLQSAGSTTARTRKAITLIKSTYTARISLEELAAACCLSVSRFSFYFKMEHGRSVREYVKHLRISKAKKLLTQTSWPVQKISYAVGYQDVSLFNRIFKAVAGETPKQLRQRAHPASKTVNRNDKPVWSPN